MVSNLIGTVSNNLPRPLVAGEVSMAMHDFHTRLEASDRDALFTSLAALRATQDVSAVLRSQAWPDWAQPETQRGA